MVKWPNLLAIKLCAIKCWRAPVTELSYAGELLAPIILYCKTKFVDFFFRWKKKSRKLNGKTCSNEILNAISSAQKGQKPKKKKISGTLIFSYFVLCLGLNTPRNQPGPDWGRGRDAG